MKPLLFYFLCIVSSLSFAEKDFQALSQEAYSSYQKGEQAQTISERNTAFNQALEYYLQVESVASSGELFYNIANAYFQLQEYEKALLYYARAKELLPREQKIDVNLEIALSKISNPESWHSQYWLKLFTLKQWFSKKEMNYLFLTVLTLSFASFSLLVLMKLYSSLEVARQSVKDDKMTSAFMKEFVSYNVLDADYIEAKEKEEEKQNLKDPEKGPIILLDPVALTDKPPKSILKPELIPKQLKLEEIECIVEEETNVEEDTTI